MPRDVTEMPTIPSVKDLLGKGYTAELQEAFPDIIPPYYPVGFLILVQIRSPKKKAKSIILVDETRDREKYQTQTALVRAMGPAAYKNRTTLDPWPEGNWCRPGQFVRVPMYGGDRVAVKYGTGDDEALFMAMKDGDVIGIVTGDPLAIKTLI